MTTATNSCKHHSRARAVFRQRELAVIAVTAALMVSVTTGTAASALSDSGSPTIRYAITQRACTDAPTPGDATCFADARIPVSEGTPGAEPFTIGGYSTGPKGGYTPADLLTAYGLTSLPANAGSGQTVAVVDAFNDPHALADLNHFDENYGLPDETSSSFKILNQTGATSPLPANDSSGWSVEESLDVDAVRGICHNCTILLVETNDNENDNLAAGVHAAVTKGATEVSNSYGGEEGTTPLSTTTKNNDIAQYNYPGVVITASTGDDGWYDWGNYNEGTSSNNSPELPAGLPDVVAVGGTSLVLNSDGTRNAEAVWNENGPADSQGIRYHAEIGASGGGCSLNFTAQAWQSHIAGFSNTGCGTSRLGADVSALADPYTGYDIYDSFNYGSGAPNGWATYGGTSLASPLVAAMWALAGGAQGVDYPSLTLYGHENSASSPFYDVVEGFTTTKLTGGAGLLATGGNDWCGGAIATTCASTTNSEKGTGNPNGLGRGTLSCVFNSSGTAQAADTQCTAATGFDGTSGVGTPNGLAGFAPMTPTASFTAASGVTPGVAASFNGSATDPFPGGTISSYTWSWGDGSGDTVGASSSHTFASPGIYQVTLAATDSYGQSTSVTHDVTVGMARPAITSISPVSGPDVGGTTVTISGSGFTGATKVTFGSAGRATGVSFLSDTKITAVAPTTPTPGLSVHLTVTTPAGTSTKTSADIYHYN